MECFSSCVYILAAGVAKQWIGAIFGNQVGIHRPYLTQTPREGVQVAMRKALANSRAYFAEMNIPEQLADAMFSIPPDKVEILTDDKLAFYRLQGIDMVFEEEMQLKAAALYGMTRQQYMQNSNLASEEAQRCRQTSPEDGLKCIVNAYRKYGVHQSQQKQVQ